MAIETTGHCRKCGESDPRARNGRCMNVPASEHDWVEFAKLPNTLCRHCKKVIVDYKLADGCPCNSPRGINHGLVPSECCTCKECDPAQTGASRMRPTLLEGTLRRMKDDHGDTIFALVGADGSYTYDVLDYEFEDKKIRITIEEIP